MKPLLRATQTYLPEIADGALVGLCAASLGLGLWSWYHQRPRRSRLARRLRTLPRAERLRAIRQILAEHPHAT